MDAVRTGDVTESWGSNEKFPDGVGDAEEDAHNLDERAEEDTKVTHTAHTWVGLGVEPLPPLTITLYYISTQNIYINNTRLNPANLYT